MRQRDPAKAVQVLDLMLEFFDGGRRWMRGMLRDASRQHRCLIGALRYVRRQQRIRGAGTEFYLHAALLSMIEAVEDPLIDFMARAYALRAPDDRDLMDYNDCGCPSYDEVRALIVEARALAQAELAFDAVSARSHAQPEGRAWRAGLTAGDPVLPKIVSTNR